MSVSSEKMIKRFEQIKKEIESIKREFGELTWEYNLSHESPNIQESYNQWYALSKSTTNYLKEIDERIEWVKLMNENDDLELEFRKWLKRNGF